MLLWLQYVSNFLMEFFWIFFCSIMGLLEYLLLMQNVKSGMNKLCCQNLIIVFIINWQQLSKILPTLFIIICEIYKDTLTFHLHPSPGKNTQRKNHRKFSRIITNYVAINVTTAPKIILWISKFPGKKALIWLFVIDWKHEGIIFWTWRKIIDLYAILWLRDFYSHEKLGKNCSFLYLKFNKMWVFYARIEL